MKTNKDEFPIYGPADDGAVRQMKTCLASESAVAGALMADHHLGYSMPIGGVIAYRDAISPSGIGYDIGCGNKAVKTKLKASSIRPHIPEIMDEIWDTISFGVGRNRKTPDVPGGADLWNHPAWKLSMVKPRRQMAENQLGTVGSGNHYVDIFEDEDEWIWVGVHFGSRGLGHKIATHFMKKGGGSDGMHADPVVFDVESPIGSDYLSAMDLAGRYAYAGRNFVCEQVCHILHTAAVEGVHNHHNFAWQEEHNGEIVWVVRKGATPNEPGQLSFVGGSMAGGSVILEGQDAPDAADTLYSTVHGAGRVMGRREAAGKTKWIKLSRLSTDESVHHLYDKLTPRQVDHLANYEMGHAEDRKIQVKVRDGKISLAMMQDRLIEARVVLRGGGTDESPHCYKHLPDVLDNQGETIRVVHELKPLGVAMAGAGEFDPYKD